MSKTVKAIAWICLVLGLVGTVVDAGVVFHGRQMMLQAQDAFEAGYMPAIGRRFNDSNKKGEFDREDFENRDFDRDGRIPFGGMMDGKGGFDNFSNLQRRSPGMRTSSFGRSGFGFLALMFVGGPILAIIGAVILIVNREPKAVEVVDKKEKKAKSKKA